MKMTVVLLALILPVATVLLLVIVSLTTMLSVTVGKLTLIETHDYAFDQKVTLETQENMDNLMRIAQKDHIKFVKIPEKYSPELLDKARTSCK